MEVNNAVYIYSFKKRFENSKLDETLINDIFSQNDINIVETNINGKCICKKQYRIMIRLNTPEKLKYYEEIIKPMLIEDRKDGRLYHNLWI